MRRRGDSGGQRSQRGCVKRPKTRPIPKRDAPDRPEKPDEEEPDPFEDGFGLLSEDDPGDDGRRVSLWMYGRWPPGALGLTEKRCNSANPR